MSHQVKKNNTKRKVVKPISASGVRDNSSRHDFIHTLRWPFIAAQAITSALLCFALAKLNLLQIWQFILVIAVLGGLLALNTYKLFISQNAGFAMRLICCLLAVLVSVGAIFGFKYIRQTIDFVENITGVHYETQTYSVLALKSSGFNDIAQLRNQHVGFLTTNPNLEETKARLKTAVDYKETEYDELGSLVAGLSDFKVAGIVLTDSYIEFLEENNEDFIESTKVIYTFEVRIEEADTRKAVDVISDPFIVYISGSDSRGAITDTARSDVNIIAVVNPAKAKILLVSIPRDYYVQLHGTTGTRDKLTHAGIYGIDMSRQTIEDLFGVDIHYTLKVGFKTVTRVVDVLDGIDIDSDQEFTAWTNKTCKFKKGTQHVDSACALAFARERYAYTSGDRHRGQNQQQVMTKIIEKLSDPHYMTRYSDILKAADGSFETSLSYDEITNFARYQLSEMKHWTVESISVDGTGAMLPTYSMGSQRLYVMLPNQATVNTAKQKIQDYLAK